MGVGRLGEVGPAYAGRSLTWDFSGVEVVVMCVCVWVASSLHLGV